MRREMVDIRRECVAHLLAHSGFDFMKPGELAQDIVRTVWSTGEDRPRPLPTRFHVANIARESLFSVKGNLLR